MTKAYSYIRFSTPEQAKGDSYRRQREECEKYCKDNNLELATEIEYTFFDKGKSASKGEHLGENGQLARFLSLVKEGQIEKGSWLIVESLDRLSREHITDALPQFVGILSSGINIYTLMDGKAYTKDFTATDLILSIFVMSRAYEESHTKSVRVGKAWRNKQEQARSEKTPIGKAVPYWLHYQDSGYQPIPEREEIVKRIFQMCIDGYGKTVICKTLNAEGVPSFGGTNRGNGTWATSSLQRLLSNRAVLGEYQPYTKRGNAKREPIGEVIKNYYPTIIDEEIFYQAQAATSNRRISGATKQSKRFNVWQGIAKCDLCKSPMHLVNKGEGPKGGSYLYCSNNRKGICKAKGLRIDRSELAFKEILAKVDSLALVQDSSAKINKDIQVLEGILAEENQRLTERKGGLKRRYSDWLNDLVAESEEEIKRINYEVVKLNELLAGQTITNKADFFSRLDLESYEGRSQANALLKRIRVQVYIKPKDTSKIYTIRDTYRVHQNGKEIIVIMHLKERFYHAPRNEAQFELIKQQEHDGKWRSNLNEIVARNSLKK